MSEKKIKDSNFIQIVNIFNKNKINYWLCHGTLLGIIRDQKLIDWDHDIDLALWENDTNREQIIKLLVDNGFVLRKGFQIKDDIISFFKKGGRIVDINFYIRKKLKKTNEKVAYIRWYVPKNIFCKLIDGLSNSRKYNGKFKIVIKLGFLFQEFFEFLKYILIKYNFFYKEIGYSEPEYLLNDIKKIRIDDLEIRIPSSPEKYLEYLYGHNWKIPKKDYIWHKDSNALTSSKKLK